MMKLKKIVLGVVGVLALSACCLGVVDARTGTNIKNGGPKGNSLQARIAVKLGSVMDQDGSFDITQNSTNQRLVNLTPDVTTFALGTATYYVTGSNTTATEIGSLTGETAGDVFTIIVSGGANYATITDNAGDSSTSAFSLSGTGGWIPVAAGENATFLVLGDNDYEQIGTSSASP
jgi:hypothetical protein